MTTHAQEVCDLLVGNNFHEVPVFFSELHGDADIDRIATAMRRNTTLENLCFFCCRGTIPISAEAASRLAEAMVAHRSLRSLYFDLGDGEFQATHFGVMARILCRKAPLSLWLDVHGVDAEYAQGLRLLLAEGSIDRLEISMTRSVAETGETVELELAEALASNTTLRSLDIDTLLPFSLATFQAIPFLLANNLESLSLCCKDTRRYSAAMPSILFAVSHSQSLTKLKLSDWTVRPQDIELLGGMLANSRSLRTVNLSLCPEGPLDILFQGLANGLASETCAIEKLTLLRFPPYYYDVGIQAAHDMARAIRGNTSLTTLNLGSVRVVGQDGVKVLAAAFHHNSVIEDFTVNFEMIDRDGANAFGRMLEVNTTLKSLVLECAQCDLVAFAEQLPRMTHLRVLRFRANNIRALATG